MRLRNRRKTAETRQRVRRQEAARVEQAVRRSGLRRRAADYDWAAELERQGRRVR